MEDLTLFLAVSSNLNHFVALLGGIAAFITPCVLPMVPIYLSIISGVSIDEMKSEKGKTSKVIFAALLFILGYTIVFSMLGLAVGFLNNPVYKAIFNLLLGLILILFGLHYAGVYQIRMFAKEARFHTKSRKTNVFKAFFVGFLFAFGWTPCVGPILGAILGLQGAGPLVKVSYMLAFSIGLGLPLLISAFAINFFFRFFDKIKKHFHKIEIGIGILLMLMGAYYIFDVFKSGALFKEYKKVKITEKQKKSGANFKFVLKDGKQRELKDIKANVYIVNIWETWCTNCKEEMPHFSELYQKYKDKGVYILAVCSSSSASTLEEYNTVIKELKPEFPVFYDTGSKVANYLYSFHSKAPRGLFPLTFILDKNRQVIKVIQGARNKKQWEDIILKAEKK